MNSEYDMINMVNPNSSSFGCCCSLFLVGFFIIMTIEIPMFLLGNNVSKLLPDIALTQSSIIDTTSITNNSKVSLALDYAHFMPLVTAQGNQVKVLVDYTLLENKTSIIGQTINGVMKVYNTTDRTLLRTSAFPTGFTANVTGTEQFATTFTNNSIQNVTAVVQFTNVARTVPISNSIIAELDYGQKV